MIDLWWLILGPLALLMLFLLAMWLAPEWTTRRVLGSLLALRYSVRLVNGEHVAQPGPLLIVSNHMSWLDGVLMMWKVPRRVRYIVDAGNFKAGWLAWLAKKFDTILMSAGPKGIARALREAREGLARGDAIGIFPEGTISRTYQVQGFRPGVMRIASGTEAKIVPCYLYGLWGSIFSFSNGKFFRKWPHWGRRHIDLYCGAPLPTDTNASTVRQRVTELEAQAMQDHRGDGKILSQRLIDSWRKTGSRLKAADSLGTEISGRQLLLRSLVLRYALRRILSRQESNVGILLPPGVAAVATNASLAFDRRVATNLNYTLTKAGLDECIRLGEVKHVISSRRFIDKLGMSPDAKVILLEELRDQIGWWDKLRAACCTYLLPGACLGWLLGLHRVSPDDLLTIIFTSGSTGTPKGVMLSYANITHNVDAVNCVVHLVEQDNVLGVLPFFHAFGYAITLWAAMCAPCSAAYHFNPLDAKTIGNLAEKYRSTILLATPTFLRGYLRRIEKTQFAHLNAVIVGAEKMPADLFEAFEQRFGVRPSEGYGCTELSPLVSVNIPARRSQTKHQVDAREGSVGRPVPGVALRVVSPEDGRELPVGEEGLLWVKGANAMQGYWQRPDLTEKVIQDGWYSTGDLARIDEDGFLHITGRQSRFSKIAGEMVPHGRVEEELGRLLSEGPEDDQLRAIVTAVPDEKKGERLVVLHLPLKQSIGELRQGLSAAGLPNLYIPGEDSFFEVVSIPLLGSGKQDLKLAQQIAAERARGTPPG
jgi:acyl-[acyl-carrier-protein]-phospholipid O-acyltransferase/long-chain-fatty-acid--[acyl-carrier-protein] ligase